jgi:hypothetical protein
MRGNGGVKALKKNIRRSVLTVAAALMLAAALGLSGVLDAQAKTISSARGENIFFYAENAAGKSVLLKVIPLEDLKSLSHGQLSNGLTGTDTGKDYYISTTDNYPTTQYCQARGITVPELVDYVKKVTTVSGASALGFSGSDALALMATDSYGSYSRSWTYDQLYGVKRYYFEGLYAPATGWKTGWEITGEDNSKFGVDLDTYNAEYKEADPYYADKRAAFDTGTLTVPILATESLSGRTTSAALNASAELGIADYIAANSGVVAGCLSKALEDTWSLRLSLPMTEADLMAAHRTAYDNFKWIYNLRLDMANAPSFVSQGTVAAPQAAVKVSADAKTITITLSCVTPGAAIFYSYDGAPQIPYTTPLTVDISGRSLSSSPITFYMTAVKEGYDDEGVITAKYPGLSPAFASLYSGMAGQDIVFSAASGVTADTWSAWTGALTGVTLKTPSANGYLTIDKSKYAVDNTTKTISFDKSLFTDAGSYSFIFHASKYADKNVSLAVKKPAPAVTAAGPYYIGGDVTLTFPDKGYQTGLAVYLKLPDGTAPMISPTYLDRSAAGRVTVKAAYFASDSCRIKEPGTYTLELSNTSYSPDTQDVSITVQAGSGFTDVVPGSWFFDAVKYVSGEGLFSGTGEKIFSPNAPMTRAMFVTVLARLAKADTSGLMASGFSDVDIGSWYGPSVAWAVQNKLVGGITDSLFMPDASVTREQLVTMLYRYAEFAGADTAVSVKDALNAFTDAGQVSPWAREAMAWAAGKGLIKGSDGLAGPQGAATRAQVATIFMNYDKACGSADQAGGAT